MKIIPESMITLNTQNGKKKTKNNITLKNPKGKKKNNKMDLLILKRSRIELINNIKDQIRLNSPKTK